VFALRVAKSIPIRRVSAFHVEAEWIDALFNNQWFCVPKLHRTEGGECVGQVQDASGIMRASTLLSWIPGRRCYRISEPQARTLGQMGGALHQYAQTTAAPPGDAIKAWDSKLMCGMFVKDGLHNFAPEVVELVEKTYFSLQRIVATLDTNDIGLINADLGLHNVLWGNMQVSLVDFNDSGIGPYAFCLARLMERIRLHAKGQVLADELLSGYREVTPLPAAYEKWSNLFELAAAVFKLKLSTARVANHGTTLKEHEQRTVSTLNRKFEQLKL
jgi:Ser/Thr protein kinase RdoA (MazF antagonist)